jgi:RNA polymerase sigma factor for flagellar operon FliA
MGTTAKSVIQKYKAVSPKETKPTKSTEAVAVESAPEKPVKAVSARATAKPAAEAKGEAKAETKAGPKAAAGAISAKGASAGKPATANAKGNPKENTAVHTATGAVGTAIDKAAEANEKLQKEIALQAELAKELVVDAAYSNKLVKGDFSPVNTNRERLIREYAGLIKFIAQKIAARLPSSIELDDLISSGVIGLMDAIDKYDSSRDNKFKTYAEFRIRGAILDELRSQDWVPRSVREKSKILERAYSKIEQEKGRQATDEEACIALGMTTEQYHEMLNEVRSVSLLSYDDLSNLSNADKRSLHGGEGNSKVPTPYSEVNVASLKKLVAESIEDLPEKQRLVLSLYYYEDLNLKEIGRVLDVTESRVSQLHSQAILKLKARLRNHWDDFSSMMGM